MRVVLLLVLMIVAGSAAAEDNAAFVRAVEAVPGVVVTHGEDGGHPYTEWREAGVFHRLQMSNDRETLLGDDESGAGAVMCSWTIYNAARDALVACPADRYGALRADLDRDIAAMETSIVADNVLPVTVTALRAQALAERARMAASLPRACAASGGGEIVEALDAMGRRAGVRPSKSRSRCNAGRFSILASDRRPPESGHER